MRRQRILIGLLLAATAAPPSRVVATSRDFIDETLVSQPFKARELGIEFGAETRLDSDYRLQGWYRWEFESAPLSRWFLEAKLETTSRGAGLEWGGWSFGTRFRFLDAPRWPVDVSAAVEYEVETSAGKHPNYERELVPRLLVSKTFFDGLLATVDLGAASRLTPNPVTKFAYGAGVRYPEGGPLVGGIEALYEPLEKATRITPQLWMDLPHEMRLRMGGIFGTEPRPYHFIARLILETEF